MVTAPRAPSPPRMIWNVWCANRRDRAISSSVSARARSRPGRKGCPRVWPIWKNAWCRDDGAHATEGAGPMPLSLTLSCLWVLAAAIVAMLPMRLQYAPGLTLLILSVPLGVYVGLQVGWIWVAAVLFAVLSMYRRPLMALVRHLRVRLAGET